MCLMSAGFIMYASITVKSLPKSAITYAYLKPQVESMSRKKFNSEQTPQLITANEQMRKIGLR